jgi:hypothetical protein
VSPFEPAHLLAQGGRDGAAGVGSRGSKGIWGNDGHRPLILFQQSVSKNVLFLFYSSGKRESTVPVPEGVLKKAPAV